MGLDPPYLADRESQLDRLTHFLAGFPEFPRNVRLTGLRGVGKTVLLQRYASLAEAADWLVIRRECSEHLQDQATFGLAVVEDCRQAVLRSSPGGEVGRRVSAVIRQALDILGGISVSLAGITVAAKWPSTGPGRLSMLDDQLFAAIRSACSAVASEGESAALQSVLRQLASSNDVAKRLIARLIDKGLLFRPERGRLAFTVPLFGDYLRRRVAVSE